MYGAGGVVFVSARVLVLDLLRSVVPFHLITGVLVHNAHVMEEHGVLSFVLRLVRYHCPPSTFIKGFCDHVQSVKNPAKLEAALRALFTGKLLLWPRFEARIAEELSRSQPQVIELFPALTPNMKRIMASLQSLTVAIVKEVAKAHKAMELPEVTMENALRENWSSLMSAQLAGQWNYLGKKTRQLLKDVGLLRKISHYLLQYDCVMFNRYLLTMRQESLGDFSTWMFEQAANDMFQASQARVTSPADGELVLEPQPKWLALQDTLEEIRKSLGGGGTVLVVCRDERTCSQLAGVLAQGARPWLAQQYSVALEQRMYARGVRSHSAPSFPLSRSGSGGGGGGAGSGKKKQQQHQQQKKGGSSSKRRAGSAVARAKTPPREQVVAEVVAALPKMPALLPPPTARGAARREAFDRLFGPVVDPCVVIHSLDGGESPYAVLRSAAPACVVMYDADLAFLRALECYKSADEGGAALGRVYMIAHDDETEEERALQEENVAFEEVIAYKSSMIVEDERGKVHRGNSALAATLGMPGSSRVAVFLDPRDAQLAARPYVVVDTRELNGSKIPSKMWSHGLDVIPMTLEIGDYIVSDDVCVERKTVADLISSFADGRLYKQCENMQKHYSVPVLLIEFTPQTFYLQPQHEITQYVQHDAISSKLALLVLHYPRLRLFWSRDVQQSLTFMMALRKGLAGKGPNLERIKQSSVGSVREGDDEAVDATPQIVLSHLPGVLAGNRRAVMERAQSLRGLIEGFDEAAYGPVMGTNNAADLGRFLKTEFRRSE